LPELEKWQVSRETGALEDQQRRRLAQGAVARQGKSTDGHGWREKVALAGGGSGVVDGIKKEGGGSLSRRKKMRRLFMGLGP
jgi:hypothetical protein